MATIKKHKGTIGILTGGGDVPGLNPAIRAVTIRAIREGYRVIGIRHGWAGVMDLVRDEKYDNSVNYLELTENIVNKAGRTGDTFLQARPPQGLASIRGSAPFQTLPATRDRRRQPLAGPYSPQCSPL